MAWRCSGDTQVELVRRLRSNGLIHTDEVENAMLAVDRTHFTSRCPYVDAPMDIGHGATLSAPHMHAMMANIAWDHLAKLSHRGRPPHMLDVGSGSGIMCAILKELVPNSVVVGIERIEELYQKGIRNLQNWNSDKADSLHMLCGDGKHGAAPYAPFDVIHVGAAAKEIPHDLLEQLADDGIMIIPIETSRRGYGGQVLYKVAKDGSKERVCGVMFVPLI